MRKQIQQHYFIPGAALIIAADYSLTRSPQGLSMHCLELSVVADLCLLLPLVFWLCYRHTAKQLKLKTLALILPGIWLAYQILPTEAQLLRPYLQPLRYLGSALFILIELWIIFAMYRRFFSKGEAASLSYLRDDLAMPAWLCKLLVLEARFVSKLIKAVKKYLG